MDNTPPLESSSSTVEEMTRGGLVLIFGTPWDAPAFDDAIEVTVPVGKVCLFCTETIAEDDSGTFTPYLDADGGSSIEAVHIECWLRSLLGCVSHLAQRCSCYGGDAHEGHTRADARAVMDWLVADRARGTSLLN